MTRLEDIRAWTAAFAACVRERDFARGRSLFAVDVSSFGTVARRAQGLRALERDQWRRVWPVTEGFDFDGDTLEVLPATDGSLVVVLADWASRGVAENGETFPRRGRATLILAPRPASPLGYEAVHSHFSFLPEAS